MRIIHLIMFLLCTSVSAASAAPDSGSRGCINCHFKLTKGKVVHAAMQKGCPSCHVAIKVNRTPHVLTGKIPRGLSADQPALCFGCHDKAAFSRPHVHAALGMGCSSCHNPHTTDNPKLLKQEVSVLCMSCHDKSAFEQKVVHPAVSMGCLTCHEPHSTQAPSLLKKTAYQLCLDCHAVTAQMPHIDQLVGDQGHYIGGPKNAGKSGPGAQNKPIMDPSRPTREFYCGSCHAPHSSTGGRLLRFDASSGGDICANCHK
jgi:predicted CXXCH cytochrome family protein